MATEHYLTKLVDQLWEYRGKHFPDCDYLFDDSYHKPNPPVFTKCHASWNVLLRPEASREERTVVWEAIPPSKRQKWFGSMKSSQALAQSVFANLRARQRMDLLSQLMGGDGMPLFHRRPSYALETDLECYRRAGVFPRRAVDLDVAKRVENRTRHMSAEQKEVQGRGQSLQWLLCSGCRVSRSRICVCEPNGAPGLAAGPCGVTDHHVCAWSGHIPSLGCVVGYRMGCEMGVAILQDNSRNS